MKEDDEILNEIRGYLEAKPREKKYTRRKLILLTVVCLILAYFALYIGGSRRFEANFYRVETGKLKEPIRVVGLTDLHNAQFGEGNEKLISRIRDLNPDIILIAGDMVTAGNEDIETAVSLCEKLTAVAPVFYSYGNHENKMVYGSDLTPSFLEENEEWLYGDDGGHADFGKIPMKDSALPDALSETGVILLNNNTEQIRIGEDIIDLAGINSESGAYYPYSSRMMEGFLSGDTGNLKIIIAHRPTVSTVIESQGWLHYDLLFSGHTHGGLIRIPGLGGMFRSGRLWPLFTGMDAGMSKNSQGTMILGRGLGNSNFVPRIFNLPELIVADIS